MMKIMKFVVKVIIALVVMEVTAFGAQGWYCALGVYFDRMQKVVSEKRKKETGSISQQVAFKEVSQEERKISARNFVDSIESGWKWKREMA